MKDTCLFLPRRLYRAKNSRYKNISRQRWAHATKGDDGRRGCSILPASTVSTLYPGTMQGTPLSCKATRKIRRATPGRDADRSLLRGIANSGSLAKSLRCTRISLPFLWCNRLRGKGVNSFVADFRKHFWYWCKAEKIFDGVERRKEWDTFENVDLGGLEEVSRVEKYLLLNPLRSKWVNVMFQL